MFGYTCLLTSGFNVVVFLVIRAHLNGQKHMVQVLPDRIPTASKACIACSIIHLVAMIISIAYLTGVIKFDPFARPLRYFRSIAGLSPVGGPMRYRKITENGASLPVYSDDVATDVNE